MTCSGREPLLNELCRQMNHPSSLDYSHDLVLGKTARSLSTLHSVTVGLVGVADIGQTERPAAVLVTGELGCDVLACCPVP